MTQVLISLGSNRQAPLNQLEKALWKLEKCFGPLDASQVYETEPVGPIEQAPFLNAAASFDTLLSPETVLAKLMEIETAAGRDRNHETSMGPRTLDLDLILYGSETRNDPDFQLPHPRFRERRFVLEPASEIAADFTDPLSAMTIQELLAVCHDENWVRVLDQEVASI